MEPATTVAGATAGLFLGEFVFKMFEHVCGGMTHHKVSRVIEHAARRFAEGELPPNHDLEGAIHKALGQTARVLAYQLHNPKRGPMGDLLSNLEVGNFLHRFAELAQNNILAGIPRDHWLAALIQETKDPKNFRDFPLKIVLDDYKISRLLTSQTDAGLREYFHQEFLAWVERHVPDNGHKPSDFADKVKNGWIAGAEAGGKLAFYDVFGLFFREALKLKSEVFHAFSVNVLTGLTQDMEEIKAALPDRNTFAEFEAKIQSLPDFQIFVSEENEKFFRRLKVEFDRLHARHDRHDADLAEIKAGQARLIADFENLLKAQQQQPSRPDANAPRLDFPRALRELAAQHNVTPEQARREVESWIAEVRRHSTDLSERARAEFLSQHFAEAARLSDEAGHDKLQRSRELGETSRQLQSEAADDFTQAGKAFHAQNCYADALTRFALALDNTSRMTEAVRWAGLQIWLGICHGELGIRVEGQAANQHLREAVTAFRAALTVYTREQLPQDWAMTQNNLGAALWNQAERSEGAAAVDLLAQAVTAYRAALTVYTREQLPQYWAATQNNLGNALSDQAARSEGAAAVDLLAQAVTAYRAALTVYTREQLPQYWAATQNNLGNALSDQAARSEGAAAVDLLAQAVTAFRAALTVRTREQLPYQWTQTQNNLKLAEDALRKLQ